MFDQSRIVALMSALRSALSDPLVLEVTDHFAGYFDELGITITVKPETSDEQVRELKQKIAPVLSRQQPFQWLVMFRRQGKQIAVLFPDGLFTLE
jgi:hypothetical protein